MQSIFINKYRGENQSTCVICLPLHDRDRYNPQSHSSLVKFSQAIVPFEIPQGVEDYHLFPTETELWSMYGLVLTKTSLAIAFQRAAKFLLHCHQNQYLDNCTWK